LANQSQIAEQAVRQIAQIYAVEREVKELSAEERLGIRQDKSQPLVQALYEWLVLNRQKVHDGSATAKGKRPAIPSCFSIPACPNRYVST
jgi:hypothetical protein